MAGYASFCRRVAIVATCVAVGGVVGCGYSFSGRVRAGEVYIPFFEDQSSGDRAVNVGVNLTDRVVREFLADRGTHVFQGPNERSRAAKELTGTVKNVTDEIHSRNPEETGEEYRVVVTCSVT